MDHDGWMDKDGRTLRRKHSMYSRSVVSFLFAFRLSGFGHRAKTTAYFYYFVTTALTVVAGCLSILLLLYFNSKFTC